MKEYIRLIYLYLVSLIALVILVVNAGILLNLVFRTWVFPDADRASYYGESLPMPSSYLVEDKQTAGVLKDSTQLTEGQKQSIERWLQDYEQMKSRELTPEQRRSAERQRDAARSLSYLLVSAPIFYYHWRLARKEREQK